MTDFAGLGLTPALVETLARIDYTQPTPIQEQTIPTVLKGRDVLGTAQTGTGKTGAFAIPIIDFLLNSPRGSALIMTPTRELAAQVQTVIKQMLAGKGAIKTALLIGGEPMPKQLAQLRTKPRIIIGTPGRINDHLTRGSLMLHDAGVLVLDETDRMLDMGFGIQIDAILKFLPKTRQTLLFSATLPPEIVKISKKYLTDPVRVEVGQVSKPALNIDHKMERATDAEKYPKLLNELEAREGSIIIFVKTKRGADKLAFKLHKAGHGAEAIHGDLRQNQRDRVIKAFRNQRYRVMVATDVAARGLDIPHIEHVINYDLPQCAEDYIHRIGRTARAGAKGAALCYVSPAEGGMWKAISKLLNPGEKVEGFDDDESANQNRRQRNRRGNAAPQHRKGSFHDRRKRKSFDDRPKRSFGENKPKRSAQSENRMADESQSVPAFIERPYKEQSRAERPNREFKKRDYDTQREKPKFNRDDVNKNREGRNNSHKPKAKHSNNVTRYDGAGSSYFRPSDQGNNSERKNANADRAPRKERSEYNGKPKSFNASKPRSDKRFGGHKKGKFAA